MTRLPGNIAHLRHLKGITQELLADELGIKKSRLGAYEEGRSEPPLDLLVKLSDYFDLPIDILVKKDLTKATTLPSIEVGYQRVLFPITVDKNNRGMIELVDLRASAGYLNGYGDPEYIESLPKMQLPFVKGGTHRAFPIKGDSMLPLSDGDIIVGRFVEDIRSVKDGTPCIVLTTDEGIVYKRIFRDKNSKHRVMLHSDNPVYPPYPVLMRDIREVWSFVCCIGRTPFEPEENSRESLIRMLKEVSQKLDGKKGK
ncbi:MAG: XRE family transcriptional regulator [Bacteroidota bacterium]